VERLVEQHVQQLTEAQAAGRAVWRAEREQRRAERAWQRAERERQRVERETAQRKAADDLFSRLWEEINPPRADKQRSHFDIPPLARSSAPQRQGGLPPALAPNPDQARGLFEDYLHLAAGLKHDLVFDRGWSESEAKSEIAAQLSLLIPDQLQVGHKLLPHRRRVLQDALLQTMDSDVWTLAMEGWQAPDLPPLRVHRSTETDGSIVIRSTMNDPSLQPARFAPRRQRAAASPRPEPNGWHPMDSF
jgi:hypothetical protein